MWTRQKRRYDASRFILPLLSIGIGGYFFWHIYHGQYGLHAREDVLHHIQLLETQREQLEQERDGLQQQIALLRDGSIEKDTLDEYARRNLNLARANELVILLPD